jgi:hypothetical protein
MHPSYLPVFFWSLIIFVSFLGYGETLRRALNRTEFHDLGWGLTSAWGMATILAIGGLLMAFHLAITPILTAVVVLGAALGLFYGVSSIIGGKVSRSTFQFPLSDLILYLLAAIAFASSIAWSSQIDPNDDLICYLMLPKKILSTGTLIEPFSFQRAGTFGGQALLQALVMIVGAERNGHVPDRGLAMVMMFGLLVHATRGLRGQQAVVRFLLLFAFWLVPVPRISTHGAINGGMLLVSMLATRELALKAKVKSWICFIPVGLLLAGACCIRPTFTVLAGAIFLALCLKESLNVFKTRPNIARTFSPYAITFVVAFVLLVPFMLVLLSSNGTPMIPPFSGYVSKAYQIYAFNDFWKDMGAVLSFYTTPEMLCILGLLAVTVIFKIHEEIAWIVIASLLAASVIVNRYGAMAYLDQYRFIYPLLVPLALWFICKLLQKTSSEKLFEGTPLKEKMLWPIGATSIALAAFILVNAAQGSRELREQFVSIPEQIKEVKPFFDPNLKKAYEGLQNLVPPDVKILTMVDASYWLDFKRNTIYSINAVGSSSPPPGMPFQKGPHALANYLKGLGIRYVIAVDFNNAVLLYTRKLWAETTRPEWIYPQIWRPRFLDVMDNFDALDKEGTVIARAANARLFDLGP